MRSRSRLWSRGRPRVPKRKPREEESPTNITINSLAVTVIDRLNYAHMKPRSASPLLLFSRYDGNIVGGSILGIGLALSGACPGTVLVQAGVGIRSGWYALDGAVLAGIAWIGFLGPLIEARRKKYGAGLEKPPSTVYEAANVDRATAFFGIEAIFAAIIAATIKYTAASPFHPLVAPYIGGLFIGGAQLLSLLTRRCLVGVSSVFEDVGKHFWWLLRGADTRKAPSSYDHLLFSAGIMSSAFALAKAIPEVVDNADAGVTPTLATLGGALGVLGARMAGGCTSGHGISGISVFSTSSFLTIASMFGAAALVAPYVN